MNLSVRVFYLFLFLASVSLVDAAEDCADCEGLELKIDQKNVEKARYESLVKSNEDYLEQLGNNDVSKRIKLRSNLMVIGLRLETVRNELDFLKSADLQQKCKSCSNTTNKPQVKE